MEEFDITGGESGIDRRDFIRKSALVGGMVWAAPMISSIGSPAFAFTEGGDGGGNGGTPCEQDISNVAVLVRNGTFTYKYEVEGGGTTTSQQPCVNTLYTEDKAKWLEWCDSENDSATTAPTLTVDRTNPKLWVVTVVEPDYTIGWAITKQANECYLVEGNGTNTLSVGCPGTAITPLSGTDNQPECLA